MPDPEPPLESKVISKSQTALTNDTSIAKGKWVLWLIAGAVVVIGSAILLATQSGRFVVGTIRYVVDNLAGASGLPPDLVMGVVILLTVPFFWAVAKYVHSIYLFHGLHPSLRLYTNGYGLVIVIYIGGFFLARSLAARHAYASKWCAETSEGILVYDRPGKDPIYGIELRPCSADQIAALRSAAIQAPHRIDIYQESVQDKFFDPRTGRAQTWFYQNQNGTYELFDAPGYHPVFHARLKPMTEESAGPIAAWVEGQQRARPRPTLAPTKSSHVEAAAGPPGGPGASSTGGGDAPSGITSDGQASKSPSSPLAGAAEARVIAEDRDGHRFPFSLRAVGVKSNAGRAAVDLVITSLTDEVLYYLVFKREHLYGGRTAIDNYSLVDQYGNSFRVEEVTGALVDEHGYVEDTGCVTFAPEVPVKIRLEFNTSGSLTKFKLVHSKSSLIPCCGCQGHRVFMPDFVLGGQMGTGD